MRRSMLTCMALLLVMMSLPASAVTMLQYDFEDAAPGVVMNSGTAAAVVSRDVSGNGFDMWGWASATQNNSPWGSALGDAPAGYGISARFPTSGKDGYTNNATVLNAWSPLTWTIEVSFKLDNLNGWQTIIGRSGSSLAVAEADFYLQKNDVDEHIRLNFGTAGAERFIMDSNFALEINKWYHLAVVSDGTTVTMYADKLDGLGYQVVASQAFAGSTSNALAQGGFNWTIGRGWFNGGNTDFVVGNIDDVRFSDVALTPDQFLHSVYDLGNPVPGDRSINASRTPTLTWAFVNPGITADSYNVYGPVTDPNLVDPNQPRLPDYTTTSQSQAITGTLPYLTKYYWRVDAIVGVDVYSGPAWSFTTIPASPVFPANPAAYTGAFLNTTAVLTATAQSPTALTDVVRWYKVGTPDVEITMADPDVTIDQVVAGDNTTSTLTIANVQDADAGNYYAKAVNSGGTTNSTAGSLVIKKQLAYYPFEGDPNDASGNGMNGTGMTLGVAPNNVLPSYSAGKVGQAVNLSNTYANYIDLPDGFSDFRTGLTINLWAYPTAAGNWANFISLANGAPNNNIFFCRNGTGTTLTFRTANGTAQQTQINGNAAIALDQWQMFTATVDTAGVIRLYKNGMRYWYYNNNGTHNTPEVTIPLPLNVVRVNNYIGKSAWPDAYFNGQLDEIRIYNYALSDDEIADRYVADNVNPLCRYKPTYDADGDCRVTVGDLSLFAAQWLDCGLYPANMCP